jgi:hypothetical protein
MCCEKLRGEYLKADMVAFQGPNSADLGLPSPQNFEGVVKVRSIKIIPL